MRQIRFLVIVITIIVTFIFINPVLAQDDGGNGDTSQGQNDSYSSNNEVTSSSYDSYGNEWSSGTDSSSVGEGSVVGHSDQVAENHGNGGNDGGGQGGQGGEGGRAEGQFGTNGGEQGFDTGWDGTNGDPMAADRATLVGLYEAGKYGEVGSREAIAAFSQTYAHTAEAHGANPAQAAGDLKDTLTSMGGISQSTIADAVGYAMAGGEEAATPQQVANSVYNQLTNNGNVTTPEAAQASWNHAVAVAAANGMDIGGIQAPNGVSNPTSVSVTSSGVSLTSAADAPGTSTNVSISVGFNASGGAASTTQPGAPQAPASSTTGTQPPAAGANAEGTPTAVVPATATTADQSSSKASDSGIKPATDPNTGITDGVAQTISFSPEGGGASTLTVVTNSAGTTTAYAGTTDAQGVHTQKDPVTLDNITLTNDTPISSAQAASILQNNFDINPNYKGTSIFKPSILAFTENLISAVHAQESPKRQLAGLNQLLPIMKQQQKDIYQIKNGNLTPQIEQKINSIDPFKAAIAPTSQGYILFAGKDGRVSGQIKSGEYSVEVSPIDGYSITAPMIVNFSGPANYLGIAVQTGESKVNYLSQKTENLLDLSLIRQVKAAENLVNITGYIFNDKNKNLVMEKDDKFLPWSGYQIELTKIDTTIQVKLEKGWNLVGVPTDGSYRASTLLAGINSQSGDSKTVSVLNEGSWQSYSNGTGTDFDISLGKSYFIFSGKNSVFIPSGTPVKTQQLSLNSGWNALTVPALDASELAGKLELNDLTTLSSYKKGHWEIYQANENRKFGSNFKLAPTQGVLIKVKNPQEISF